jgi:cell division protein FtsB
MENNFETIILALITAVFSTKGWEYIQSRLLASKEEKQAERADTHLYRDDLRTEVNRLRDEMIALYADRDTERQSTADQFAQLKEQLAVFKTRVEFLEKEISSLEQENNMLRKQLEVQKE